MDKIILKDETNLLFEMITPTPYGLIIRLKTQSVDELEGLLNQENLSLVKVANPLGAVYGLYEGLMCESITRNLIGDFISLNLLDLAGNN